MRTVLVIEPDAATRDAIAGLLEVEQLATTGAPNVAAAWETLANGFDPCLAVVEVPLPRAEERLFEDLLTTGRLRDVPILATTTDGSIPCPKWAAALLVKPYDPADLSTAAVTHCRPAA